MWPLKSKRKQMQQASSELTRLADEISQALKPTSEDKERALDALVRRMRVHEGEPAE